jgi:MFS superfamily sulfate permease-like transporter
MWLDHDLAAGLTVFFVALPLCLGIALASGAPLYAGIMSGIIGGVLVGVLSGSHLSVSGPAAGLSTVVAAAILSLGSYQQFLLAVVVAGLFQIVLGVFRLGVIASYFPSSVIKGMLAAIGIILISKQIPIALGYSLPNFWTSGFLEFLTLENYKHNLSGISEIVHEGVLLISVVSFAILIILKQPFAKKLQKVPAPLIAVLAGVALSLILPFIHPKLAVNSKHLVYLPSNFLAGITFPDLTHIFSSSDIWKEGAVIGLLASLETLLCIEAIDKLDKHNRRTPLNRELLAQGAGNITCGLLGAIPITAVVVRGAANVVAGGRTRLSTITHGVFLFLAAVFFTPLINTIPYAPLAAILTVTGYNLTKPKLYTQMWKLGMKQFLPFIFTIIIILLSDLLVGVCIGLLFAAYFIISENFKTEYVTTKRTINGIETYYIKLNSHITFLNKVKLRKVLREVPEYSVLTIDGSESVFIDHDVLELISEFESRAKEHHIELHLKGIKRVEVTDLH